MRSGDRGEVEIISPCSHDVLLKPDSVLRSRRIPLTKLLNLSCYCRCYTMFSKCDLFSEVPVLAISGVVDTYSISTGDGWTEGTNRFGNSFGLRSVTGSKILAKLQELGCI